MDERFVAACRVCCYLASGSDEFKMEDRADNYFMDTGHRIDVMTEEEWEKDGTH